MIWIRNKPVRVITFLLLAILAFCSLWGLIDTSVLSLFLPKGVEFYKIPIVDDVQWSPDDKFIVGEGRLDGNGIVISWPLLSEDWSIIGCPDSFGIDMQPVLSPDGMSIVTLSCENQDFVIQSLESQIEIHTDIWDNPVWAHDGKGIYFIDYYGNISYYQISSGHSIIVKEKLPDRDIWDIAISRKGDSLAMVVFSRSDETSDVYISIISLEDEVKEKIYEVKAYYLLGWSPNGNWLFYSDGVDEKNIFVIDLIQDCQYSYLDLEKLSTKHFRSISWSWMSGDVAIAGDLGGEQGVFLFDVTYLQNWVRIHECVPLN